MSMALLLIPLFAITAVVVLVRPIYGLFLVILSNQAEYFVPLSKGVSLGRMFGVIVALAWLASLMTRRKSKIALHQRFQWPMLVFVAIAAIGVFQSKDLFLGVFMLVKLGLLVFLALLIEDLIASRADLQRLIWIIAVSYGLSSIGAILQFREFNDGSVSFGNVYGAEEAIRFAGLFSNPNNLGIMLMSGIPFLVMLIMSAKNQLSRAAYLGIFASAVFALFLSASRTHTIALFVFLAVYFGTEALRGRDKTHAFLVATGITAVLLTVIAIAPNYVFTRIKESRIEEDASTRTRYQLLTKGFQLASEHPLVGVGLGNSRLYPPGIGRDPHETLAVLFGETGLLGAGAFAGMAWLALRRQRRIIRIFRASKDLYLLRLSLVVHSAFVAFLAISPGNIILYQRMFWVYFALTAVLSRPHAYRLFSHQPGANRPSRLPRIRLAPRESGSPIWQPMIRSRFASR